MTDALAASIGVLVVDDHQLFAAGLARLLADEPDITVLGIATSGAQAWRWSTGCSRRWS